MSSIYLTREEIEHPYADLKTMLEDKRRKAEQISKTVFHHITQSPEVLAEKLVYPKEMTLRCVGPNHCYEYHMTYGSTLFPEITFKNHGEAFIKTVERLKEVKR